MNVYGNDTYQLITAFKAFSNTDEITDLRVSDLDSGYSTWNADATTISNLQDFESIIFDSTNSYKWLGVPPSDEYAYRFTVRSDTFSIDSIKVWTGRLKYSHDLRIEAYSTSGQLLYTIDDISLVNQSRYSGLALDWGGSDGKGTSSANSPTDAYPHRVIRIP